MRPALPWLELSEDGALLNQGVEVGAREESSNSIGSTQSLSSVADLSEEKLAKHHHVTL